jgi:hypothetical protein
MYLCGGKLGMMQTMLWAFGSRGPNFKKPPVSGSGVHTEKCLGPNYHFVPLYQLRSHTADTYKKN